MAVNVMIVIMMMEAGLVRIEKKKGSHIQKNKQTREQQGIAVSAHLPSSSWLCIILLHFFLFFFIILAYWALFMSLYFTSIPVKYNKLAQKKKKIYEDWKRIYFFVFCRFLAFIEILYFHLFEWTNEAFKK